MGAVGGLESRGRGRGARGDADRHARERPFCCPTPTMHLPLSIMCLLSCAREANCSPAYTTRLSTYNSNTLLFFNVRAACHIQARPTCFPTYTMRAPPCTSLRMSSDTSRSYSTTSAVCISCTARKVSNPGSPGPVPTRKTRPGTEQGEEVVLLALRLSEGQGCGWGWGGSVKGGGNA